MNAAARRMLRDLSSLTNIEQYLNAAKAELASDPTDVQLGEFVKLVEDMLRDEKAKLVARRN